MKFAIVAALMAAVSAAGPTDCSAVELKLWKDKDCTSAAEDADKDAFVNSLGTLTGGTCTDKTIKGTAYSYKAQCEDTKHVLFFQLYKDGGCTTAKKVKDAVYTMKLDEGVGSKTTCTQAMGSDKFWYTGTETQA